jgi:uncharacterized NAD(P)/FAD-binding protein YdhS
MADIAIIGGGAAGAAVFGALLSRDAGDSVHWVAGETTAAGLGIAYSTQDEHHLLNVRASGMGLYLDADEDFATYSSQQRPGAAPTDFLPRRLFGQYIESQLRKRLSRADERGRRYQIHKTDALSIWPAPNGYNIMLGDGTVLAVQRVVLALGAMDARPLRTVSAAALESGAYVLEPWSLSAQMFSPRRLTVIGTGLTAVDTLISASKRWPDAELVAVSRHGLLPFTHPPLPIAPFSLQAELNATLMSCNGPAKILSTIREVFTTHQAIDWRSVIDGMRPINAALWQRFDAKQRRQFLRHVRWVWESSRHRLAPESADILQQLRDEGRLQIHSARVLSVGGSGPLDVTIRSRATQRVTQIESDIVVQATGLDTAVAFAKSPLLSSLLKNGLAAADALQLGLLAEADGQLINADGHVQRDLYAIGSLLRGNLWECTAMPEIRSAADKLATTLIAREPAQISPIAAYV